MDSFNKRYAPLGKLNLQIQMRGTMTVKTMIALVLRTNRLHMKFKRPRDPYERESCNCNYLWADLYRSEELSKRHLYVIYYRIFKR